MSRVSTANAMPSIGRSAADMVWEGAKGLSGWYAIGFYPIPYHRCSGCYGVNPIASVVKAKAHMLREGEYG